MTNPSLFRRMSRDMEKYKAEELRTVPLDMPTPNRTSGELAPASQLPIPRLIPWLLLTQTRSKLSNI